MTESIYKLSDAEEIKNALLWLNKRWDVLTYPEYYHARSVEEAVSLLAEYGKGARIIAGGTDLVGLMKNRVLMPEVLVNIKMIPHLKYIKEDTAGLAIGALTLINDIERSTLIKNRYPILFEAACQIASPQIRNMATIGGNLCQQVRCWYYRRSSVTGLSFDCRRKKESGVCYAVDGENQHHAIFGGSECFAVNPSDMATVLLALDASINTVNCTGARLIPIERFYTDLGNILEPGEIITGIQVPHGAQGTKQRFLKFRTRKAIDFAIASVATVMTLSDNIVTDARIVLGGVSPKPYRAVAAEEIIKGQPMTTSLGAKAAKASAKDAMPLSKNGHKVPIVEALVKRVLLE